MMKRRELRELMHCCRPDLSDLTAQEARALTAGLAEDAELRREWETLQSWDATIGRAMHDVPVPDGLADRLLAVVRRSASDDEVRPLELAETAAMVEPAAVTRRRWMAWPAGVAAAVLVTTALVLVALFLAGQQDNLTAAQLVEASGGWVRQLQPAAWRSSDPPLVEFPPDMSVRLNFVAWQPAPAILDSQAVVYRAELPPNRATALLFVIRTWQGRQLPAIPPFLPDSTTGNVCIGVWKNAGCLYVLLVPGPPSDYQRSLRSQAVA